MVGVVSCFCFYTPRVIFLFDFGDVKMGNPVGPGMFKAALADTPREAFNWRLAFSVICFGLMVLFFPSTSYARQTLIQYRAQLEDSTKDSSVQLSRKRASYQVYTHQLSTVRTLVNQCRIWSHRFCTPHQDRARFANRKHNGYGANWQRGRCSHSIHLRRQNRLVPPIPNRDTH